MSQPHHGPFVESRSDENALAGCERSSGRMGFAAEIRQNRRNNGQGFPARNRGPGGNPLRDSACAPMLLFASLSRVMRQPLETCWTLVRKAATGDGDACGEFANEYLGVVRAFLRRRWRGSAATGQVDDAVQEVFLDLFRGDGALTRLDPERTRSFRSFLFGVAHKVALRYEERYVRDRRRRSDDPVKPEELPSDDSTMSRVFDREWAQCMMRRAAARQRQEAEASGPDALRRVELLELRFRDNLPIRTIAERWGEDAARLHHEYARAREEFKRALYAEIRYHREGSAEAIERECQELIGLLR